MLNVQRSTRLLLKLNSARILHFGASWDTFATIRLSTLVPQIPHVGHDCSQELIVRKPLSGCAWSQLRAQTRRAAPLLAHTATNLRS